MADLSQTISGLYYRTPFVVASSPLTDHVDLIKIAEEYGAGAASLKLTLLKQPNKGIRQMYAERGYRMFNPSDKRNDLEQGLELMRKAKEATSDIVLWANMAGTGDDLDSWVEIAKRMEEAGADALELNFICPNMTLAATSMGQTVNAPKVGALVGKDPVLIKAIVSKIKENVQIPVWTKMTSEVEDYLKIARATKDGGADGLVINGSPLVAPPIDIYQRGKTKMATLNEKCSFGGCGGPVLRPLSYRLIAQVAKDMEIPIAGGGGLEKWEHAVEAIMLGSSLVTFCTKILTDGFSVIKTMSEGLGKFMDEYGYENIQQMRGIALPYICMTAELENTFSYAAIDEDKCNGCGSCEKVGSCRAIKIIEKKAVVDKEKCEGCGLCKSICARQAISFIPW